MLERLCSELSKENDISFAEFMRLALYDPQGGYYAKKKTRVGRLQEADFYTAQSLQQVFYPLLLESIETLLEGEGKDYMFVEIGAESEYPLPDSFSRAFKGVVRYGYDSLIEATSPIHEKAILFSNELFDAQPFHRLIYKSEKWQEIGLRLNSQSQLEECLLPELSKAIDGLVPRLPSVHTDNYQLDISLEANQLLTKVLKLTEKGLFIAFDYGGRWEELLYQKPQGTARAYYRHTVSKNLLHQPGEQDLTCHVCWDFLMQVLKDQGCADIQLKTQEAFFMHQASKTIQCFVERATNQSLNFPLQSLKELIHPQHMGHAFQVLYAKKA